MTKDQFIKELEHIAESGSNEMRLGNLFDLVIIQDRESRWISVKNKLPKHEDYVLITDGLEVWVGSYGSEDFRGRKSWGQAYVGSSMVDDTKITHWQPLPEAPKQLTP